MSNRVSRNVKFYVRILPSENVAWEYVKFDKKKKVIYVQYLQSQKSKPLFWCFNTDGIFYNACQSEVYNTVIEKVIPSARSGVNITVLAIGQTFSGKSFTISGLHNQFELRGITPLFVHDLFATKYSLEEEFQISLRLSIVEFFNEKVYDLLAHPVKICKHFKDITRAPLISEKAALCLLFQGESRRNFVKHAPYFGAHAGNMVVTFHVESVPLIKSHPVNTYSKVHFVDLAGIETVGRQEQTSFKVHDIQGVANKTKTLLELFLITMKAQHKFHSKPEDIYRTSKLISYLGESFSPHSKIRIIGHIRPTANDIDITLSVLRFGMNARGLPSSYIIKSVAANPNVLVDKLRAEVTQLHDEIIVRRILWDEEKLTDLSQAQLQYLKRLSALFLQGDTTALQLTSTADPTYIFTVFKELFSVHKELHKEETDKLSEEIAEIQEKLQCIMEDKLNLELQLQQEQSKRSSPLRHSEISVERGISHASSVTTKKSTILGKQKTGAKQDKPKKTRAASSDMLFESHSVQVNLIESEPMLATPYGRQELWLKFIEKKPDLQESLEMLKADVKDKQRTVKKISDQYYDEKRSLEEAKLNLGEMALERNITGNLKYDDNGKVITSKTEADLAVAVKQKEDEVEALKELLFNAQQKWGESSIQYTHMLEKVEQDFQVFCAEVINLICMPQKEKSIEDKAELTHALTIKCELDENERCYLNFQKKYFKWKGSSPIFGRSRSYQSWPWNSELGGGPWLADLPSGGENNDGPAPPKLV